MTAPACRSCGHFRSETRLITDYMHGDELIEVPRHTGECRANPPQATFWGSGFPRTAVDAWCGLFIPKVGAHEAPGTALSDTRSTPLTPTRKEGAE